MVTCSAPFQGQTPCAYTVPESIYSTAHPGYEGEPDEEEATVADPVPAGDDVNDTKEPSLAFETVSLNNTKVPALVFQNSSQGYAQIGAFFVVILAVVAWFIRRRHMTHEKIDEKTTR